MIYQYGIYIRYFESELINQQQASPHLWNQHVKHDTSVGAAIETREIYQSTSKCQPFHHSEEEKQLKQAVFYAQ